MEPPIEIKNIRDFAYITSRKLKNARDEPDWRSIYVEEKRRGSV